MPIGNALSEWPHLDRLCTKGLAQSLLRNINTGSCYTSYFFFLSQKKLEVFHVFLLENFSTASAVQAAKACIVTHSLFPGRMEERIGKLRVQELIV